MRKWLYILMAVLPVLSCSREKDLDLVMEPEGRVEITFTVTGEGAATKALGESPNLQTMHLAIFGGSGYLKEYVQAEQVGDVGEYVYHFTDNDGNPASQKVPEYTYKCSIALSNSSRRVHFIGNGPTSIPFGRDNEVLPTLLSEKETGFWQMVSLPNVTAKQDGDGDYTYNGNKRQSGDPYDPSDELKTAFSHIPLIRNWAKIILKAADDSNFTPYSFAVVNKPMHGTLVPYGGEKGFITNYEDLSFDQLRSAEYNYGGNLPTSVEFDHSMPSEDDFKNYTNGVKQYNADAGHDQEAHAVYLYERPVPDANMEPTYVIVYGKYYNPEDTSTLTPDERENGVDCYYKVDLMQGSEYYPVLRNFIYEIQIDKISARGHDTPAAAAAAAGSADVSADINASTLPDISDGTRRMAIQYWMSKTFIRAQEKDAQLYVVFYDNINGDAPAPNLRPAADSCITYELIPANAGIVKNVEIGEPFTQDASASNYGWRPISFGIASPEEAQARTQTLRIKCKTNPDDVEENPLYRDVVISLLPTQTMRVSCSSPRVLLSNGEMQQVDVAIPDGLVESMFPLYFLIEAKNLTLAPDPSQENLPVISEKTIIPGSDYPSYHFQRTLTWDEYIKLDAKLDLEDESLWRTFSSHFITNCEDSATEVFVSNEFFYTGSASFTNYASFRGSRFTTSVPCEAGRSVTVTSQLMSSSHLSSRVYLDLVGLKPADGSGIEKDADTGEYYFDPSALTMNFNLVTTTDDGEVSVTLRSKDLGYEAATIRPWRFRDMKIVDMATNNNADHKGGQFNQVAFGNVTPLEKNPGLLISYYTDPESYKFLTGNQKLQFSVPASSGVGSVGDWNDNGNISTTAQDYYREKWFNVVAGTDPVSVTLSAAGYKEETVTAPRFKGDIYSLTISSAGDLSSLAGGSLSKKVSSSSNNANLPSSTFNVQLSSITEGKTIEKQDTPNRIVLPAGGQYELEASISSDNGDVYFYYVQIFYHVDGTTAMKPNSYDVDPDPDGSIYSPYLGNNYEYYWNLPYGETAGKLVMKAPSNRDIVITRIVLRGFHGVLNDSGHAGGGDVGFDGDLNNGGNL